MKKKHIALQILRSMSGKDKFVDRMWRKAEFYDKQRSSSFSRSQMFLSSASDLEAETAFKMCHGMTNSSRYQVLRQVYDRKRRGPIKGSSPVKRVQKGRRNGKYSCKISSTFGSSFKYYNGSENCSLNSSCISSCSEGISTSCNFSSDECSGKIKHLIMDPLHVSKGTSNHALHGKKYCENHTFHSFTNQNYHEQRGDLDQSVRKVKQNHLGLSQKYRPKSFKEFVGQEIVRKSLMNAILKQKIAPLYVFYGPRGTGKTSAARIFASALNCSSPDARLKPCCKCRECCLCMSGESRHMTELSAAGNDGIERLKLCLKTVKSDHHHMASGYRVVIVEDCHELSRTSFLKCMENQNTIGYLVFILITVDLKWIPKTVMSRSQKFCFKKLGDTDILNRLKMIVVAKNINIEEEIAHHIDHWKVYEAPLKVLPATESRAIEDEDSRNVESLDTKCWLAESSINPLYNHDTQGHIYPLLSPSKNCTSEEEKLELRPLSPCTVEEIWKRVLKTSQSATLEDLLQGQGKLVSLLLCQGTRLLRMMSLRVVG